MSPASVTLDLPRGDTGRWNLTFSVNLTGAKIWFTAKRVYTDADDAALIALSTTTSGITITDAPNGLATLVIPPASTASLTTPPPPQPLTLDYDIQVKESDGTVTTVQQGKLNIRGDVTNSTA
jgi:hypothetical protein